MRLIGFSVECFKSIQQITVKPLSTANCLIGPNNEGKSSVLEALLLLRYLVQPFQGNDVEANDYFRERQFKKSGDNRIRIDLEFAYCGKDLNSDDAQSNNDLGTIVYTLSWRDQVPAGDDRYIDITDVNVYPDGDSPDFWAVTPHEDGQRFRTKRPGLQSLIGRPEEGQIDNFNPADLRIRINNNTGDDVINQDWGIVKYLGWWASKLISVPSVRQIVSKGQIGPDLAGFDRESLPGVMHKMRSNQEPEFKKFEALIKQLIPSIKQVHTFIEPGGELTRANRQLS